MRNNIQRADLDAVIRFLSQTDPILTHATEVRQFEEEWSQWLGVRHSVFVNSGSSANELTMLALRHLKGHGKVIVPPLTWVSDIAAVLHAGLEPVFADIDPHSLALDAAAVEARLGPDVRAVFLTHVLGYNGLTGRLLDSLTSARIPLIEDVCESHGATHGGRKLGTFGWASNFSFYYAHHLSTIEGGMVCTNDEELAEVLRMLRSHGMVREARNPATRERWSAAHPDLNPSFIFAFASHNMRSTEINAVLGRSQLPRLDDNNRKRSAHLARFLGGLDPARYQTEFVTEGNSNYAFTLVLREPNAARWRRVEALLSEAGVEFRRGLSGGGNQIRQPYIRRLYPALRPEDFPRVEHVHFFGCYIGNYPDLEDSKIDRLCGLLNEVE